MPSQATLVLLAKRMFRRHTTLLCCLVSITLVLVTLYLQRRDLQLQQFDTSLIRLANHSPSLQQHRIPHITMSKTVDANELKQHKSEESAWTVVDGKVYDVTEFLEEHPGGKKILLKNCGKDASESFWTYHSEKVLEKVAKPLLVGEFKDSAKL
ncbi:hypothetical protein ACQY0O_005842 [Thecaphora frezii]